MTENIDLRRLGKSNLQLSPVGLGCLQMSRGNGIAGIMWPKLGQGEVRDIVKATIAGGINWFDTAELYGWGASERALSTALQSLNIAPGKVHIATKWWPLFRTAGSISGTISKRFEYLSPYWIDLYQIHNPFSFSPISSQMSEMAKLAKAGKIRYVGVSNFSANQMRKAHNALSKLDVELVSNQVNYSLIHRKIELNGVIETANELGVSIIAFSPLGRGLLTGKFHDSPELIKKRHIFRRFYASLNMRKLGSTRELINALKEVAGKYDVTPSQAAINWVINSNGGTVFAIPGATKVGHAEDNAAAMKFKLSSEDMDYLDGMSESFK